MDYNTIGFIGLALLGLAIAVFFGTVFAQPDDAFPAMSAVVILLAVGMGCVFTAAAMQNSARAKDCVKAGGVYLTRERACLTPELFKGRLP